MDLSDILEVTDDLTRPRWVECPEVPGFALLLRLPDVPGLRGLAYQASYEALEKARQAAAAGQAEAAAELEPGAVALKWAHYAVQDWRGLTGAGLRHFAEGARNLKIKTDPDTAVPFRREVLQVLVKWSPRFFEFVDRAFRDLEIQGQEEREDEEKNSSGAPGITPIPPGQTAPGAPAKKRSLKKSRIA